MDFCIFTSPLGIQLLEMRVTELYALVFDILNSLCPIHFSVNGSISTENFVFIEHMRDGFPLHPSRLPVLLRSPVFPTSSYFGVSHPRAFHPLRFSGEP